MRRRGQCGAVRRRRVHVRVHAVVVGVEHGVRGEHGRRLHHVVGRGEPVRMRMRYWPAYLGVRGSVVPRQLVRRAGLAGGGSLPRRLEHLLRYLDLEGLRWRRRRGEPLLRDLDLQSGARRQLLARYRYSQRSVLFRWRTLFRLLLILFVFLSLLFGLVAVFVFMFLFLFLVLFVFVIGLSVDRLGFRLRHDRWYDRSGRLDDLFLNFHRRLLLRWHSYWDRFG